MGSVKPKTLPKEIFKYYRSNRAGLKLLMNAETATDATLCEYVRFTPYQEKHQGDMIKVGYLATERLDAIERLKTESGVTEISEQEYLTATGGQRVL
jgi:hypothetical protein